MSRSDNIRADLDRIRSMSSADFEAAWGAWCRNADRDLHLMRQRWTADLEYALPFAEREDAAVMDLVAAKDNYRANPTPANRDAKDAAVAAVQAIRAEERSSRHNQFHRVMGDAIVSGG